MTSPLAFVAAGPSVGTLPARTAVVEYDGFFIVTSYGSPPVNCHSLATRVISVFTFTSASLIPNVDVFTLHNLP